MLRLRVVSEQRRSLAERSSAIFSVEGGTIGRSADNDWVLPDPQRYVWRITRAYSSARVISISRT